MAELNAQAANLELAKTAGSRYLVQRWGDGTLCDKTGQPREVEVQVRYFNSPTVTWKVSYALTSLSFFCLVPLFNDNDR